LSAQYPRGLTCAFLFYLISLSPPTILSMLLSWDNFPVERGSNRRLQRIIQWEYL